MVLKKKIVTSWEKTVLKQGLELVINYPAIARKTSRPPNAFITCSIPNGCHKYCKPYCHMLSRSSIAMYSACTVYCIRLEGK